MIGPGEDARTRAFVAGLPPTGAVVFVLDRLMQDFTRDLVRATHGIRGCEATSIFIAPTEADEAPFHIENRRPVFRHPDVVKARGRADEMRAALVGTPVSRPAVSSARGSGRTTMMVRDATAGAIIFTHHPAMRDHVRNLVKRIHPPEVAATIDVHVAPSPIDEMRITAGSHRTRHVLRDHALLEERAVNAPLIPRTVPDKTTAQPAPARLSLDTLREWRMPNVAPEASKVIDDGGLDDLTCELRIRVSHLPATGKPHQHQVIAPYRDGVTSWVELHPTLEQAIDAIPAIARRVMGHRR